MKKYYAKEMHQIRNWQEETERTEMANSEVTVRQATPEELAKFEQFPKHMEKKRTVRSEGKVEN
jgi:hypothetical protein